MSALLWVDTSADEAIDLGNPLHVMESFAEMERVCGDSYDEFADLFGVPEATMDQDDVDPSWLSDVRVQASEFLSRFGGELGDGARGVLEALTDDTDEFSAAGEEPNAPDPDSELNAVVGEAMVEVALDAAEQGDDPHEGLERLRALLHDRDALHQAISETGSPVTFAGGHKWNEADHPRSAKGHFISKDRIAEAKDDPKLADQLRREVKPEDRDKLERALKGETDLGRTKRGEAMQSAARRREARQSTREAAESVLKKLTREGDLKGRVTADDLHALADYLQSGHMTVADLRRVKDAMRGAVIKAGFGGARTKAAMVQALVSHAKGEAVERRIAEQGITAPEPTPEAKPEPDTKQSGTSSDEIAGGHAVGKLKSAIDGNPALSPEQRQHYHAAIDRVAASIPPAAHERIAKHVKEATFHPGLRELARAVLDEGNISEEKRKIVEARIASGRALPGGAYNTRRMSIHVDGDRTDSGHRGKYGSASSPAHAIYAHELGHAIDGPAKEISSSPEWQRAFADEINQGSHPLTDYAATKPEEGLAEFSRLLYGSDVPHAQIEREFPQASAVFKVRGLWPVTERTGPEGRMHEAFDDRIDLDANGSHIDTLRQTPDQQPRRRNTRRR